VPQPTRELHPQRRASILRLVSIRRRSRNHPVVHRKNSQRYASKRVRTQLLKRAFSTILFKSLLANFFTGAKEPLLLGLHPVAIDSFINLFALV
jgi:hypothetical protein